MPMKINGRTPKGNVKEFILPRDGEDDLHFIFYPVPGFDEFDKYVPEPQPRTKFVKGEGNVPDFDDPVYKKQVRLREEKRNAWMFLKSIAPTPGLEWETVKLDSPDTWLNYRKELEDAGISAIEFSHLLRCVAQVNSLDQEKIDEALQDFLRTRDQAENSTTEEAEA